MKPQASIGLHKQTSAPLARWTTLLANTAPRRNADGASARSEVSASAASLYSSSSRPAVLQDRASSGFRRQQQPQQAPQPRPHAVAAAGLVASFFERLNRRDLSGMFALLGQEVVYENSTMLSTGGLHGKQSVVRWYIDKLSSVPRGTVFVLDELDVPEAPEPIMVGRGHDNPWGLGFSRSMGSTRVAVAWHMELSGVEVPGSRGVSMYRVAVQEGGSEAGPILEMKDTPQGIVSLLLPALTLATPVIDSAAPLLGLFTPPRLLGASGSSSNGVSGGSSPLGSRQAWDQSRSSTATNVIMPTGSDAWRQQTTNSSYATTLSPMSARSSSPAYQPQQQYTSQPWGGASTPTSSWQYNAVQQPPHDPAGLRRAPGLQDLFIPPPVQEAISALQSLVEQVGQQVLGSSFPFVNPQSQRRQYSQYHQEPTTAGWPQNPSLQQRYGHAGGNSSASGAPSYSAGHSHSSGPTSTATSQSHSTRGYTSPGSSPAAGNTTPRVKPAYQVPMRSLDSSYSSSADSPRTSTAYAGSSTSRGRTAVVVQDPVVIPPPPISASSAPPRSSTYRPTSSTSSNTYVPPSQMQYTTAQSSSAGAGVPQRAASSAKPVRMSYTSGSPSGGSGSFSSSRTNGNNNPDMVVEAQYVDLTRPQEQGAPGAGSNLSGVWEKDLQASDAQGMERILDVWGLQGLQRMTARLIDGMEIKQSADQFSVAFLTVVPFFRVTEKTRFGSPVNLMRRDLRLGSQKAVAEQLQGGGVRVSFTWGNPRPGTLEEQYVLSPTNPDELAVTSTLTVGDQRATMVQVYRRTRKSRDQLLADSKSRNPSLEAVMAEQKQKGLSL